MRLGSGKLMSYVNFIGVKCAVSDGLARENRLADAMKLPKRWLAPTALCGRQLTGYTKTAD
jgi:hypothetical protein